MIAGPVGPEGTKLSWGLKIWKILEIVERVIRKMALDVPINNTSSPPFGRCLSRMIRWTAQEWILGRYHVMYVQSVLRPGPIVSKSGTPELHVT